MLTSICKEKQKFPQFFNHSEPRKTVVYFRDEYCLLQFSCIKIAIESLQRKVNAEKAKYANKKDL